MKVLFGTVKNTDGRRLHGTAMETLRRASSSNTSARIAFVGRTPKGRSGVAIDLNRNKVTGHKLEPIPKTFSRAAARFPLTDARTAFAVAANGVNVLIGTRSEGCLLEWDGSELNIYASGADSHE